MDRTPVPVMSQNVRFLLDSKNLAAPMSCCVDASNYQLARQTASDDEATMKPMQFLGCTRWDGRELAKIV